jgi:phosphoglycerate dehydrogenase-like enzyme
LLPQPFVTFLLPTVSLFLLVFPVGLGMTVVAYDPYASQEKAAALGVKIVTLDEALEQGDFFSLHTPLTPNTKNMFNDDLFAKVGRVCIPVSR